MRRDPGQRPIVVDLGYGASPVTSLELHDRLRRVRADVEVVGIEIDPERVAAATPLEREGLRFRRGGFEVPLDGDAPPVVVRAFNVLRQYREDEVAGAWSAAVARLAPDGLLVDGTSDELGRFASWVSVTADGPASLTLSWRLRGLERPGTIAERLPKALIHRNVPGEPVHAFLAALDELWARRSAHAAYGVRQRFLATASSLGDAGWSVLDGPSRWRLGELTVAWGDVAPHQGP